MYNTIKGIHDKPTANIILNGRKLEAFPLRIRNNPRMPTLTTSNQYSTEALVRKFKQKREIKGIQIRKKEVKLSLFADDMILCIENPKDSTQKLLVLIKVFSKVEGCKINTQKSVVFLYTYNKLSERIIKKTIPFIIESKMLQNKFNPEGERSVH